MRAIHYVQLSIGCLIASATAVSQQDPAFARYALLLVAALSPVLTVLGVVSGGAGDARPPLPAVNLPGAAVVAAPAFPSPEPAAK